MKPSTFHTTGSPRFKPASIPPGAPPFPNMIWIPGGSFRMGSEKHYPEERPVHRVIVDGFWMDRYPVTNERFRRFVEATGHTTFAEIPPRAQDHPGTLPEMLYAGSLVFVKPSQPVDLRNIGNWWQFLRGADWRHPRGPLSDTNGIENHPVVHVTCADAEPFVTLRLPKLYNLRTDPFERADITSNTYYDWFLDHDYITLASQAIVTPFLETFKEFPPRQKAASFTIDQALAKMQGTESSGAKPVEEKAPPRPRRPVLAKQAPRSQRLYRERSKR